MRGWVCLLLLILSANSAIGQDKSKLFGNTVIPKSKKGFILTGNASFDFPGADMSKRFGLSYRVGPGFLYKTESNWLFGAKFDFILGNLIKEDSLMCNIVDKYSKPGGADYEFINQDGQRIGVPVFERGYATGISVGRIFNTNKYHPDNGIMTVVTAGFMQHKINIYDKDKSVRALRDDYLKGYDRLTNGGFVEGYVGYVYFSGSHLINFTLGVDALFGLTQGRRDYLYDVARPDNAQRLDILFGLRGGWFIPIFRRKTEDMLFR